MEANGPRDVRKVVPDSGVDCKAASNDATLPDTKFAKDISRLVQLKSSFNAPAHKDLAQKKIKLLCSMNGLCRLFCEDYDSKTSRGIRDAFEQLKQDLLPGVDLFTCGEAEEAAIMNDRTIFFRLCARSAVCCCICTLGTSLCAHYACSHACRCRRRMQDRQAWSNQYVLIALELRRVAAERSLEHVTLDTFVPARPAPEIAMLRLRQALFQLKEDEKAAVAGFEGEEKTKRAKEANDAWRQLVALAKFQQDEKDAIGGLEGEEKTKRAKDAHDALRQLASAKVRSGGAASEAEKSEPSIAPEQQTMTGEEVIDATRPLAK